MSFNIIKQVLLCPEFKMPKQIDDEETKNCPSVQAHQTKIDFFQQSTVEEICKCLISQYLLLSKDDLELWDSDPEQYGELRNKELLLDKCERGNKIAPLWHKC